MKQLILISLVAFLSNIGTNLAHPITPFYLDSLNLPSWSNGLFFGLMAFGMFLCSPIWGTLGDSKGRRTTLLLGFIFYSVGQVFFGIFNSVLTISIARFFSGCFSAAIGISIIAYVNSSESLKRFNKTNLFTFIIALQVIGSSLGGFFGGMLGDLVNEDYNFVLFYQALYLSSLGIIFYLVFNMKDEKLNYKKLKSPFSSFKDIKHIDRWTLLFLFSLTISSLVFTSLQRFLEVHFEYLGNPPSKIGNLSLIVGLVIIVTNILLAPILFRKFKFLIVMIFSSLVGGISIIIAFSHSNFLLMIFSVYLLYISAKALLDASSVTLVAKNNKASSGVILGLRQSFVSLGAIIGPVVSGVIYFEIREQLFIFLGIILASLSLLYAGLYFSKNNIEKEAVV